MKISSSKLSFRIDIDFDGCEVDMVYKEMMVQTPVPSFLTNNAKIKIDKKKLHKTPTEGTVDFCLNWLAGYVDRNEMCTQSGKFCDFSEKGRDGYHVTELEEIGIEVKEWNGLMMGCCSLECEVDSEIYSKELVQKANKIVSDVFKKYVRYHSQKRKAA